MRRAIDDLLRVLGIAQGIVTLWAVGVGSLVTALVGGFLAIYSNLPWWSIGLAAFGAFLLIVATVSSVARRRARPPESPLTQVIQSGLVLRSRLADAPEEPPSEEEIAKWQVRVEDWIHEAEKIVGQVAPHRLRSFTMDMVWTGRGLDDLPKWKASLSVELDVRLDRLSVLRASL